jgi:hypothetical protein
MTFHKFKLNYHIFLIEKQLFTAKKYVITLDRLKCFGFHILQVTRILLIVEMSFKRMK